MENEENYASTTQVVSVQCTLEAGSCYFSESDCEPTRVDIQCTLMSPSALKFEKNW